MWKRKGTFMIHCFSSNVSSLSSFGIRLWVACLLLSAADLHSDPKPDVAPGPSSARNSSSKGNFQEGRDYTVWHRVRIQDSNGFAQPVEAYSLLLPKDWKVTGGVKWVLNPACPANAVQNRVTATSADNAFQLEVFPVQNWQALDDPMMQQMALNNVRAGMGCPVLKPFNAAEYLEQVFVPTDLKGARLVSHQKNEKMTQMMMEQAKQANAMFAASGVRLESRPSAEVGRVKWSDGRIGVALCAVAQTVSFMPNLLNGNTYASYQCQATVKTVLSAPAGREEEAERLLGNILSSARVNPEWQQAVTRVFQNIAQVEQRETAKRAAIWRQTQQEIGESQRRTWEESQNSQDRINQGWSQVLRGVETWKDPTGGSLELSAGYKEAWSKGDGTYILSNDPLFDPNVALRENWRRMEKQP